MTTYEVNEKFSKDVAVVLAKWPEFAPVRDQEVKLLIAVGITTDSKGEPQPGSGKPVTCKKLSPVLQLLTEASYLVVGDHHFWTHANDVQRDAAIFHALMAISIEHNKKGMIVFKTREPDVQEWKATVEHYGAHSEVLLDFNDAFKASAKQFAEKQKPKA